ncbi:S1 family peptidase [Actinosynnema sp. NPDC023658]|uniref:S1 family peptidase n=1 Tax=Actinosynnema sp. NPDC023658 TaxID=3155465 RepID=UPI0033DE44B1
MRTLLLLLTLLVATAVPAGATPGTAGLAAAATPLEAGTPLSTASGARCSNGFNVRGHLIVSPSCGTVGTVVRGPGLVDVGPIVAVRPTYAIVRITNTAAWVQRPTVVGGGTVTGSAETPVGGPVCAAGRTTGVRCGTVQAKNVTVNYPSGVVYGLTRTSVCSEPGDQWAPLFTGGQAQGHSLGGSGTCSTGGTSYFYPLNRILSAEGLTLVTG